MCGIGGVVNFGDEGKYVEFGGFIKELTQRGRDSIGILTVNEDSEGELVPYVVKSTSQDGMIDSWYPLADRNKIMMVNVRAVPTSESEGTVEMNQNFLQPYVTKNYGYYRAIIHNGTIANDTDFNKEFEYLQADGTRKTQTVPIDSAVLLNFSPIKLAAAIKSGSLVGSFSAATWDQSTETVYVYKNYMPLHVMIDYGNKRIWWANVRDALLAIPDASKSTIYDVPAYTGLEISYTMPFDIVAYMLKKQLEKSSGDLYGPQGPEKALVVCSSGLDSSTVAALAVKKYGKDNVTLLHYHYGCKAEDREHDRIIQLAEAMGCSYKFVDIHPIFSGMKSPILGKTGEISKGDAGIEYAKEWIPARNLIMMSIALGIAEDGGYSSIQLGANLTEQASFPDNSLDFIEKLNTLAAYSVQNNKRIRVEAPLVNLMKQEIVKVGIEAGTPYELTWSCYHDGDTHCGECAPCTMRKLAFEMNGLKDPVMP